MRLILYPDTNAFYADRHLRKPYSGEFLRLLERARVEVRLSPVVVAETLRQARNDVAERITGLRRALRTATTGSVDNGDDVATAIDALTVRLRNEAEEALRPLLTNPAVTELRYPTISAEDLVIRELTERRPTLRKATGSIGLRDTVIWQNIVDDIDADADDRIIVITNDSGFLHTSKQHLHDHLIADLIENDIDIDRVTVEPDLAHAAVAIKQFTERISNRDAYITAAILDFVGWLPNADRGGMYIDGATYAQYDDDLPALPSFLTEPHISAATYLSTERIGGGNPATCVAYAYVDIEGHMLASDFNAGAGDEVELAGAGVDGWYVEVSLTRQVRIELAIDVDLDLPAAEVDGYIVTWE